MLEELKELARLLAARADTAPDIAAADRARRLRGHVEEFLIPRAADLDAPLFVVILGSTGSGKSSLFNGLAGADLSQTGVLRPTTRTARALASPDASLPPVVVQLETEGELVVVRDDAGWSDLVIVDAPDFDSIEESNRTLARRLLEAADLIVFVTTDTRYADEVPWSILHRAGERGVPLLTVINRLPAAPEDRKLVLDDYHRLLGEANLTGLSATVPVEVVGVPLGAVDSATSGLTRDAVEPVRRALEALVDDAEARRLLVRQSLESAIADLPNGVGEIVTEMDLEDHARKELLRIAANAYDGRWSDIGDQIDRGSFLRSEVLREWQDYVGANRVARVVSEGVGKIAASIRAVF
ncbi:MAG: GTPase domain-containing protein, partial [Acidimicrobiia bacterium]|nr:GTPase domain-containing protein [Acidimicrobiia bacterium]